MKNIHEISPVELRLAGIDALIRELGVAGMVRFLQSQSLGSGDYVKERKKWLPKYETVEQVSADIDEWKKSRKE